MPREDATPIRSLLYTPGDQEQRIAANAASGADALFLDLEEPPLVGPDRDLLRLGVQAELDAVTACSLGMHRDGDAQHLLERDIR